MSVINQMLRDLDARGQGDPAARRAAMASVGEPLGRRESPWRSRRVWWLLAALTLGLALVVVLLVANRWQAVEELAEAGTVTQNTASPLPEPEVDVATSAPVVPPTASIDPAPDSAPVPPVVAPSVAPPQASAIPTFAAAPERQLPTTPTERSEPPPQAEPTPRASIERVAAVGDPLSAAREALADGRAEAALSSLAEQGGAGAERDALQAAALQQLGRHGEAEQAYRRALRQEPDIGAWWAGLGISLDASGRGGDALEAFREAQRRGPLDPALADYLGERVEALSTSEPSR